MKTKRVSFILSFVFAGLMLVWTGCLSNAELIAKRIQEKADFFTTLPAADQDRLKNGILAAGDPSTAAWIVYGNPTRTYQKITASATNLVWSYSMQESQPVDELRPVYIPMTDRTGRPFWAPDFQMQRNYYHDRYEYLRIEFKGDKVDSIQKTQDANE